MEGFKSNPKMQCLKEGGAVKYKSRHSESREMESDVAQDKAIVKKAFKMHDSQSHEGDKTDLSKLKKGGRMKKCGGGNVRKYKAGGAVANTGGSDVAKDGGKKTGGADIKTGQKTGGADIKTGKKTGSSDANKDGSKTFGLNNAFKKGGDVKKYESGKRVVKDRLPQDLTDAIAKQENEEDRELVMGPIRKLKGMLSAGKTGPAAAPAPVNPMGNVTGPAMKRGGKACK